MWCFTKGHMHFLTQCIVIRSAVAQNQYALNYFQLIQHGLILYQILSEKMNKYAEKVGRCSENPVISHHEVFEYQITTRNHAN